MSVHSKAAGNWEQPGGSAFAPQRFAGRAIVGAVEPELHRLSLGGSTRRQPVRPCNHYTRASSHLDPSQSSPFHCFSVGRVCSARERRARYLSLEVWPSRQARNAAAACSRSSALLNLRRGVFAGSVMTDVPPFTSSTPRRRIRSRSPRRQKMKRRGLRARSANLGQPCQALRFGG